MNRQGKVYVCDEWAGVLEETDEGYTFTYNRVYLDKEPMEPVSLTLPLRDESFFSKTMFSFFDGLIPEGWLLEIAEKNWKINSRDRMGLLLACCKDCIGNVSVLSVQKEEGR